MGKHVEEFNSYREKMNEKILASDNKVMKRIYSLDTIPIRKGHSVLKQKRCLDLQLLWHLGATIV